MPDASARGSDASRTGRAALCCGVLLAAASTATAQSVCLPAPRLLTTMPMGGRAGTQVEVTISGEHLEEAGALVFSDPRVTATPKAGSEGRPDSDKYVVAITADCPAGVYEARVTTRLGLSSARAFSVGSLPEVMQKPPNTSLTAATELPVNSVCNAVMSERAVDHYAFTARKGQRVVVDCATRGIDSKLDAVVVVADAEGRDLLVERRGGVLDFAVPEDGRYVVKVHDLTFKGGPAYFYRLGLWELPPDAPVVRQPSTKPVNSFSWPPAGLTGQPPLAETEPNDDASQAQKVTLPCDVAGGFARAADVDRFEFEAKSGEEWWVEVSSERLGLPTDPAVLVQHVARTDAGETLTDVCELSDVPSPVKVSSNGYAYDGPPYNAGTSDVLGKLVVRQDGLHRLQLTDLFGGTRNDPRNVYRLVIRKAAPDFALVGWALHMELRNGDRNALSKPIALRGGATMALEVIAFRRDGFDGDIELVMEGLPEGVTARGLKIRSGESRGVMLVTAAEDAPRGFSNATFYGRAVVGGTEVTRPCRMASMAWPVPDAWGEFPSPRLVADVPVSVGGADRAPLTIAPAAAGAFEVTAGEKLTIPLVHTRRGEFSGATLQLRTMGAGFDAAPQFDVPLSADRSEAVLDTAALKTPPGDYAVAFYGPAVAKYRHRPDLVAAAEEARRKGQEAVSATEAEAKSLAETAAAAPAEAKPQAEQAAAAAAERHKQAAAALAAAEEKLKQATAAAEPKDVADILVTEPVTVRVKPAEAK